MSRLFALEKVSPKRRYTTAPWEKGASAFCGTYTPLFFLERCGKDKYKDRHLDKPKHIRGKITLRPARTLILHWCLKRLNQKNCLV
jgi:hypothetical protein